MTTRTLLTRLALAALLLVCGCDSKSSSSTDGSTPDARGGDAANSDVAHADGGGGTDGAPTDGPAADIATAPVNWTIAAEISTDVGWENGMLATHPTQPSTIAVKREVSPFEPDIVVMVSPDLGKSRTPATVKTYANPGPGHYDMPYGFGFDPADGSRLALLTMMPPSNPNNPGPEPEWDTLVFATSSDSGASFDVADLRTNPWPPDGMKLVGGKAPRLAIRSQHVLYVSGDQGTTLDTVFDDSKQCLAHGDFAVSPVDEPLTFLMACNDKLLRCELAKGATKPACAAATLPSGFIAERVEFAPNDPQRVIAASDGLAYSTDGGKTFQSANLGTTGLHHVRKIVFDARPGQTTVYVHIPANNKVYRSLDGGRTYQDVTPPTTLKPPIGTYARDIAVAADGALVALGHPGVLRLAPPP
ncbi:MAG: hypothetical protein KC503_37955 [Myxococcales bacterium]|nr:hypothetical protein [Myxococcales bacterium]